MQATITHITGTQHGIHLHLKGESTPLTIPQEHQGKPLHSMCVLASDQFMPGVIFVYNTPEMGFKNAEYIFYAAQTHAVANQANQAWDLWKKQGGC